MSSRGVPPPSDPPAPSQEPDAPSQEEWLPSQEEWRPDREESWAERPEPRTDWSPESPDVWARVISERRKERGFRRPGGDRRGRRRSGRSSSDGLDLRTRSRRRRRSSRHTRRQRVRRVLKWSLLLGFLGALGLGVAAGDAYYQSYLVYQDIKDVLTQLTSARVALAAGEVPPIKPFDEITGIANEAESKIEDARFTFGLTGSLPFLGRPVNGIKLAVEAVGEEARAAGLIRDILADTLGEPDPSGRFDSSNAPIYHDGKADLELIKDLPPRIEQLIVYLTSADAIIAKIPHIPMLDQLDKFRATARAESQQAIDLARDSLQGVRLLPSLLGADGPRTYFLAMQNNSDQRATGGDLLAYGFVQAKNGKLSFLQGGGINEIDQKRGFPGAELPPEVSWYMEHVNGISNPRLRHANFTPDFPLVAKAWSSQLAHSENGMPIDAVISIDPVFIAQLLGKVSINVPSYPEPINGQNAVLAIENQQYLLPKEAQNVFPGQLIGSAWGILSDPPNLIKAAQRLGLGLRSKRMVIWSTHKEEQATIRALNWDGGVEVGQGDYLYVTDSKLKSNKVDYYTHPTIEYDVKIQPNGSAASTVTITLDNRTPADLPGTILGANGGINRALLGAYVPRDAVLEVQEPENSGPKPHMEGDAQVFLRIVNAPPGGSGTVRFEYTVPNVVEKTADGSVYRLRIQHQPMVNLAQVTVKVTLPKGMKVESAPGWKVDGGKATYEVDLDRDIDLVVNF